MKNIILEKFKKMLQNDLSTKCVQINILIKENDNKLIDCDIISLNNINDIKKDILNIIDLYHNYNIMNNFDEIDFNYTILKNNNFIYYDEVTDHDDIEIKENIIVLNFNYLNDTYTIEVKDYNPEYHK